MTLRHGGLPLCSTPGLRTHTHAKPFFHDALPAVNFITCPCNQQGGPGSVQFGYSLGMGRFEPHRIERFQISVLAVPLDDEEKDGSDGSA